ncbi:MAG: hypothetical protein SFU27_07845 [Thermonemataceae bacterium]|nr:hypothetical protein [Thermonemataceae bacterium]
MKTYHYSLQGENNPETTLEQLRDIVKGMTTDELRGEVLIWYKGLEKWQKLKDLPNLYGELLDSPPPLPNQQIADTPPKLNGLELVRYFLDEQLEDQEALYEVMSEYCLSIFHARYPQLKIDQYEVKSLAKAKIEELLSHEVLKSNSKPRTKIKVTFPSGKSFADRKVIDTFLNVLEEIGLDRVKALGLRQSGVEIVSETKHETYAMTPLNGYYVMTNTSTAKKIEALETISKLLKLNLRIEQYEL